MIVKKIVKVGNEIRRRLPGTGPGGADGAGSYTVLSSSLVIMFVEANQEKKTEHTKYKKP